MQLVHCAVRVRGIPFSHLALFAGGEDADLIFFDLVSMFGDVAEVVGRQLSILTGFIVLCSGDAEW